MLDSSLLKRAAASREASLAAFFFLKRPGFCSEELGIRVIVGEGSCATAPRGISAAGNT
jgi:hypothetical protein